MAKSTPARTKKARGARKEHGTRPGRTTRSASAADAANAWRQRVSKDAAATVDTVMAHVQSVAEQQLGRHGEFPAFLVTARKDGEYELDTLPPEELAELSPDDVLAALRQTAARRREEILCAGVAFPATLPDRSGQTAVVVETEHREGESLTVVQPYRVKGAERSVSFGDA
ncbi:MAG: hypothetical protein ACOC84_03230, partial [Actinomycetota bacterium]